MSKATAASWLADRMCRPQRIGIFGHRGVGKTTLMTMLYREAVAGRLAGCRLAAGDAATAQYLSDKIAQLESGQPLPGTLAETELHLNLYLGPKRVELVVKDYQGEHVELGRDEPIHEYLRDCDAVWLCLDSAVDAGSPALLRRQQEVEQLVEKYLAAEPSFQMQRPFALVRTKADLVEDESAERLAMTRHTLETHCPNCGVFDVSCLRRGAVVSCQLPVASEDGVENAQDAVVLQAAGLAELLGWLVAALEAQDEARLEELLATPGVPVSVLRQCVDCFVRRYPQGVAVEHFQRTLRQVRQRRMRRRGLVGLATAACLVLALWTYDAAGYQRMKRFETANADDPATALAEWASFRSWHPTRNLLDPEAERADKDRVKELEQEARQSARQQRLTELRCLAEKPAADADALWDKLQAFLRDYPEAEAASWQPLQALVQERRAEARARLARQAFDDLVRAEGRGEELAALVARADRYLSDHAGGAEASDVARRREAYLRRIDERDIDAARRYSARNPLHFQTRIDHYRRYLEKHPSAGIFAKEAEQAIRDVELAWDRHDFRNVRDQFERKPGDVANLTARCRSYLAAHPRGRFTSSAHDLLRWSERITATGEYRVVLRSGEFEKKIARYFSLGPDLSVELEVAGIRYGPSSITVNQYNPVWDFEFPRPIRWKLGDPIRILVTDHDWKNRVVVTIDSDEDDPLALRLLTGEVQSGKNSLFFECNFALPVLPSAE